MPANDEPGESNERYLNAEELFADDLFALAEDAEITSAVGKKGEGTRVWEPPSPEGLQTMLPQYKILGIIGRGGMGVVYKARQEKLKRDVAIKLLPESLTQGDNDVFNYAARFELEAQAMASLDHPAIVSVHDFGETEKGQLYFVMEFIDGMDIHQYLGEHGGVLPQEHALSIAVHVLDALEYAHQNGVVHRDIKPANILLNREGRVKIADFGLAKTFIEPAANSAPALTMSNIALGSPDFVAPEAFDQSQKLDHRADLYAVGVMLYQMLTGTLPRGQFKLPSKLNSQLDPRLDEIIDQSLQADPADRYSSAGELHQALHSIITSPMTRLEMNADAEEIEVKAKSKLGLYAGLVIAAVVMLGGFSALFLNQENNGTDILVVNHKEALITETDSATPKTLIAIPAEKNKELSQAKPQKEKTDVEGNLKERQPSKASALAATNKSSPSKVMPSIAKTAKASEQTILPLTKDSKNSSKSKKSNGQNNAKTAQVSVTHSREKLPKSDITFLAVPGVKAFLENYLKARRSEVDALAVKYLRALEKNLNKAANAGNLDLVTAFQREKKRVEALQKSLTKPLANPVSAAEEAATLPLLSGESPIGLKELRQIWTIERKNIRIRLSGGIQQELKNIERELTKSRDFVNAGLVQAYAKTFIVGKSSAMPSEGKTTHSSSLGARGTSLSIASATKDKPYENSLGMRFVPVPIIGGPSDGKRVLFSIWETRVGDFTAFIKKNRERVWMLPAFKQQDKHPAVMLNWEDAVAFCDWLTEVDREKGKLGRAERYRLPTDHEWSCAAGVGSEEDAEVMPSAKSGKIIDIFPWGKGFPPPDGAGNFYGQETNANPVTVLKNWKQIENYNDGFDRTSPVGSFAENEFGLYDSGGNVWEWCQDWFSSKKKQRVARGDSWLGCEPAPLWSSVRGKFNSNTLSESIGFRCVIAR